jgi:hypothetical protein
MKATRPPEARFRESPRVFVNVNNKLISQFNDLQLAMTLHHASTETRQ